MKTGYLIAFGLKPQPGFLRMLIDMARNDGEYIIGAHMCEGPGCANLAIMLLNPNQRFVEQLTMVLMPARFEITSDPLLVEGVFKDTINNVEWSTLTNDEVC